jgi:TatD DNase family protein
MLNLIDTHAHLEEIENLTGALADAKKAGVVTIIAVGSHALSNRKALLYGEDYRGVVYPALGWHPWYIKEPDITVNLDFMKKNIKKAVALGEIGLDYNKKVLAIAGKELQKKVLREILKIAKESGKPALIHSRYAWRDALDLVVEAGIEKAVFHWFTGPSSVLRDIIERGYYISATPAVIYHEEHRRAVKEAPLAQLLLETDSPVTYARGREGEFNALPTDVARSLRGAAALKGLSEAEIAKATTENAKRLFLIP